MERATRRATLAGAALLAAGTVAAATFWRKPRVFTPLAAPDGAPVVLQSMAALLLATPPRAVPPITFFDAAGAAHGLAEFSGRGVILNIWATWCAPCVAELPSLASLAKTLQAGTVVLPLSVDRGGAAVVQRFYAAHAIDGLGVWVDPKGAVEEALGVRGVPTTLLIDATGRERARLEGAADWAGGEARAAIRRLTV